jgi:hypothetical protein
MFSVKVLCYRLAPSLEYTAVRLSLHLQSSECSPSAARLQISAFFTSTFALKIGIFETVSSIRVSFSIALNIYFRMFQFESNCQKFFLRNEILKFLYLEQFCFFNKLSKLAANILECGIFTATLGRNNGD